MRSKFKKIIYLCICVFLLLLLTVIPNGAKKGALNGLVLCSEVIIPTLFPFAVLVLLLMNLDIAEILKPLEKITIPIFRLNSSQFTVFLLSLIGGYPIGAKLVSRLYEDGLCDKKSAQAMLHFCVNAGPAFIVLAIGQAFLGSKKIGYIFLASHIATSLILLLLSRRFLNPYIPTPKTTHKALTFSESFVMCVSDAAASTLNICAYVVLFSAFGSYLLQMPSLRRLFMLFEVTSALVYTKNIYEVSFLLGFSGICVWFQIISLTKNFGLKLLPFILSRLLHGSISTFLLFLLLKLFPITDMVISNNISFISRPLYSTVPVAASLSLMMLIFLISLFRKNYSRNLSNDIV